MKNAKVLIQSIKLMCPECKQIVRAENPHSEGLIRKDEISDRWEALRAKPWHCPGCHKSFNLPANPFENETERAEDTARRRTQGAKDGWKIRRAKQKGSEA